MKQSEIAKQLTDQKLRKAVVFSQILLLLISVILSFILFERFADWINLFTVNLKEIVYFGIVPGIVIVLIDLIMISSLSNSYYDDGGINKRIFTNISLPKIFLITLLVAVSEELLFRGVLQTNYGYLIASITFALVHVRYLRKPILLISVLLVSFVIGYIYIITGSLVVTITTHFLIDFLLGLLIRYKIWGD
ncbi:CPBP family intramembrane glutamic endopeptidase [Ornithinibacillus sp. 179-J 7C1 HS]|uniref:CPBP family intramembrane glutamic endopeptidase n=1 Tax=Ornithinibacillus sp. 179-J 7C1 HS TaxID=3142384 RepID=UPI0039A1D889